MQRRQVRTLDHGGPAWASVRIIRSTGGALSGDDWLLEELPSGVLRAAALDGVTAHPHSVAPVGADSAVWAAGVARSALRWDIEPGAALLAANDALYDPSVAPSRARAQTAVAVADITPTADGRLDVTAVGSADCFVVAHLEGEWVELVGGHHLTPAGQDRWRTIDGAHRPLCPRCADPHAYCDDIPLLEGDNLDDPSWRVCPAVGRDRHLKLRRGHATGVDRVIVSTDGIEASAASGDLVAAATARLDEHNTRDVTIIDVTAAAR